MAQRIRSHLSFANVCSLLALMVALGGTSYAAIKLPTNSVGSAQIKKNGVAGSDIRSNAVTSAKVKNGSLAAADFAAGQLPPGARGTTGATGATGATGVDGAQGIQGPAGLLSGTIVRLTTVTLPGGLPGPITSAFATCGPGERIVGGSANIGNVVSPATQEILATRPSVNDVGNGAVPADGATYAFWKGTGRTLTNADGSMRVFAICAT